MSNYVEQIRVGTGAAWPVRDAEAHSLLNDLAVDVNNNSTSVKSLENSVELLNDAVISLEGEVSNTAPGGFGLGRAEAKSWDNVDTIVQPGWYSFSVNPEEPFVIANEAVSTAVMRVDAYSDILVVQTVYIDANVMCELKRYKHNGVWQEWEYATPWGYTDFEECRTTERWDEKPVYRAAVTIGSTQTDVESKVPHGLTGLTRCIDISLVDANGMNITHHEAVRHITVDGTYISIKAGGVLTGVVAYLRYLK